MDGNLGSMKRFIFKEWYYSQNERRLTLRARAYGPMASDLVGEVKNRIHLLPFFDVSFNHSEFYVGFGWLLLEFDAWYKDYKREKAYIEKKRGRKQLFYCRYCHHYKPRPYLDYGNCNLTDKSPHVYEHECCEYFEEKSYKRKWWEIWKI